MTARSARPRKRSATSCRTCGGWGFTWTRDDVPVRCPQRCPLPERRAPRRTTRRAA